MSVGFSSLSSKCQEMSEIHPLFYFIFFLKKPVLKHLDIAISFMSFQGTKVADMSSRAARC